jgi:hypothetical protein
MLSCENDDLKIAQGIIGNIKYGSGDCMPIIDESGREYINYNGDLYFIVKRDLDNLGNGDFEILKTNSIKTTVIVGRYAVELPVDTFLVMPTFVYLYSDYNTIIIVEAEVLEKDYKFWKCTSY